MKYYRFLSISFPVGILLSGCALSQKSAITPSSGASERSSSSQASERTKARANVTIRQPTSFPNYVKPNQTVPLLPVAAKSLKARSNSKAVIDGDFVKLDSTTGYIEYHITDGNGKTGNWHHRNQTTSENNNSTLFSTTFLLKPDLSLATLPSGEVEITATDAKSKKPLRWVSSQNYCDDDDVTWVQQPCDPHP
jgi:hypothetical protein